LVIDGEISKATPPSSTPFANVYLSRMAGVLIGIVIAFLGTMFIFPNRTSDKLRIKLVIFFENKYQNKNVLKKKNSLGWNYE